VWVALKISFFFTQYKNLANRLRFDKARGKKRDRFSLFGLLPMFQWLWRPWKRVIGLGRKIGIFHISRDGGTGRPCATALDNGQDVGAHSGAGEECMHRRNRGRRWCWRAGTTSSPAHAFDSHGFTWQSSFTCHISSYFLILSACIFFYSFLFCVECTRCWLFSTMFAVSASLSRGGGACSYAACRVRRVTRCNLLQIPFASCYIFCGLYFLCSIVLSLDFSSRYECHWLSGNSSWVECDTEPST